MQNLNQFDQSAERGQIALHNGESVVISAMIAPTYQGTLRSGDGITITAESRGLPKIVRTGSVSSKAAGFILFNPVKNVFKAGDRCEIMLTGGYMYMVASDTVDALTPVQYDPETGQIAYAVAESNKVGVSLDCAINPGDLIRVKIAGSL